MKHAPAAADYRWKGGHRLPRLHAVLIAVVSAVYLASLWFNFTEAERRSVSLEIPPAGTDYLQVDVDVVYVDLLRSEITTRISFRLAGQLAQDDLTPANDLQLVLNSSKGQQQFDFPKGQRINPIEVVFPLKGDLNFYPFDHHKGVLWLFVTFPATKQAVLQPISEPRVNIVPEDVANTPGLPVSTSSLEQRIQVDTRTTFTATIPGLTFRNSQSVQSAEALKGLTGIAVNLTRSTNVVFISVIAMSMMAALAVGLVIMVFQIVSGSRHMATFHIPMAVSLIFGLPALRNIQPGVPPQGTFADTIAFTWAEIAAAGSAIALIAHWLFHPRHGGPTSAK